MKISFVSDLHLEFRDYPNFKKESGGDVLLLAGDILVAAGLFEHRTDAASRKLKKYVAGDFKNDLLDKYERVFYVMGNHEHYDSIFKNTKNTIAEFFADNHIDNVTILDNDQIDLGDYRLIGATLWSDYEKASPISMQDCYNFMNDYRCIGYLDVNDINYFNKYSRMIMPSFLLNEHDISKAYINDVLKERESKPTIVMTHHAPSYLSLNKKHSGNGLDGAYASDLSDLILGWPQIKYWVHGHTHMNVDYAIGSTRVLSNQWGYSHEPIRHGFSIKHIEG